MTGRERFLTTIAFREPDRPPHFEQMFELVEEAFGVSFPTEEAIAAATGKARDKLLGECLRIFELIIERYHWDAISLWRPWGGEQTEQLVHMARHAWGDAIALGAFIGGSAIAQETITDWMQFAVDLTDHPERLHDEARLRSERTVYLGKRFRDAGADFVDLVTDWGFNQGPFISPPQFAEFVTPYVQEHVAALKDDGLIVMQHSDGQIMPIFDQILTMGSHILHSIDPMAGMDIAEVKRLSYGKLALMGNVKCSLLQDGPDEAIRDSARYALEHGAPGGGFVFSSSNTVFRGLPLRNYDVMLDEYERFCRERGRGEAARE
jgi:uroporphyrinogen decarboxylase